MTAILLMFKNHLLKSLFVLPVLCIGLLTACQTPPSKIVGKPASRPLIKVPQNAMKVKTRASSYIYFSPIPKEDRTVYIAIQNDSGSNVFDARPWLIESLQSKSFKIVDNIDQANVVLRANVLRVGKTRGDTAQVLLDSEFGNSTEILSMTSAPNGSAQPVPNNDAVVLDLQYFERNELIIPAEVVPRKSMLDITDIQLLLLCNTSRWERFQTRIVSIMFESSAPISDRFNVLGQSIEKANTDIIRGLS